MSSACRRRTSAAVAAAALVLGVLPAAASTAGPAEDRDRTRRAGPASVSLEGRGYGHGRGLSQYGAQGAASERGKSYREILRFYYPGTDLGTAGGRIGVWITADTGDDLVVEDREGLRVRSVATGKSWPLDRAAATRWRITPVDGGADSLVEAFTGRWVTERRVAGAAELVAVGKPVTLLTPAGDRPYRGALRSVGGADRLTVNVLPLEQYLRGVVPREVPALWHPEAVKAQSVAARTYAAFERANTDRPTFDVYDTTQSQVYGGVRDEHPASDKAIRATRGEAVTLDGKPVFAQFSASNGGWTAEGTFGYLPAKEDRWDTWSGNPYRRWTAAVSDGAIEQAYPGIGDFRRLRVTRRDGNGPWNGRVLQVKVVGGAGSVTRTGEEFRATFGLRSTWFRLS